MPGTVLVAGEMMEDQRESRAEGSTVEGEAGDGEAEGTWVPERKLWKEVAETGVQGSGEWVPGEPRNTGGRGKGVHPAQNMRVGGASPVLSSCERGGNPVFFFPDDSQERCIKFCLPGGKK